MISLPQDEEPDPLSVLHTFGEIFGFVHRKEGEEGLRELLATVDLSREHLADAANELEQAGLTAPAQIIAKPQPAHYQN